MAQTSSQRRNILAMGGFLAFIAIMTLLLFLANYISQRTDQKDTQAEDEPMPMAFLQTVLSHDKKKIYERTCPVNLEANTDSIIYNECYDWKTHHISALNTLADENNPARNFDLPEITVQSFNMYKQVLDGGEVSIRQTVHTKELDIDYIYNRNCTVTEKQEVGCTEADPWQRETLRTTIGKDAVIGGEGITKARHVSLLLTTIDDYVNQTRRKVILAENGSLWLSKTCPYTTTLEGNESADCYQSTWTPDSSQAQVELPTVLSTGYVVQTYNQNESVHIYLVEESGQHFQEKICKLNTNNNEGLWGCTDGGTIAQWARKSVSTLNLPNTAGGKLNSIYGLVSEATSLGLPEVAQSQSYLQTVLSHDKTKIYERSCPIDFNANGETIKYNLCSNWKTNPVTALNTVATANKPAVDFSATGITVKSFNMYRQVLAGGVVSIRQSVHTNEGTSDYIYDRNCPITQDQKLNCNANTPWNRETFRTTIGKDAVIGGVNITKARHVSLMLTTIDDYANQTRRKVVLADDGSLWLSKTCTYTTTLEGNESAECYQSTWIPDSPSAQGTEPILPTILSTGYVAQTYNHNKSVHIYLVEESGQHFQEKICKLNTNNNEGLWGCTDGGTIAQWARKEVSTLNLPNTSGGKLNSIYGLVSEATSLGLPEAAVAKTYIRTFLSEDKGTLYEQSCTVDEALTADTIKYDTCSLFKSYPVSVLNGKDSGNAEVSFTSENVDSVNFLNYNDKNGNEKIKIAVLVDGSNLYTRSCGMKKNKSMNCTDNNIWLKQKVSKLGISDGDTKVNDVGGYDATITTYKESVANPVFKDYIREVVLAKDLKSIYTRECPASKSGTADVTDIGKCTVWDKKVFQTALDFNDNGTAGDEDIILGVDSFVQKYNGALDIRVSFIRESGETFYTRHCPLNTYSQTGSHNCNTTPKRTFSEVDINDTTGVALPVAKASGINGLLSTVTSLGFNPVSTTITPSPTPTLTAVSCSEKSVSFAEGSAFIDSKVTYTIELAYPTPAALGTVILRDDYSDGMEIVMESLPDGCSVPEVLGASTDIIGDGKVLGISDYYTERGSLLISVILLSIVSGGTAYVIVLNNKGSIKSEMIRKNPYLAGLIATGAVLILGGALIVLTRHDFSPSETPALSGKYIECTVPAGTTTISYDMTIKGEVGEEIINIAEVSTNGEYSSETCENTFTIEERELSDSLTPTPTPIFSITPSPTPLEGTPSVTPSATPIFSITPSPTPLEGTPSVTPSATPEETPSVTPSETPVVTITVSPTATIVGVACGPADINFSDDFEIVDFGGTGGFSSFYQKTCNDSANDFSNPETGVNCGGKDATQDNIVNIFDFISFADRYTSESCEL